MSGDERIGTRVVRAARALPRGAGEPVVPALVQSVAFDYASAAEQDEVFGNARAGYVYGRYGTPTVAALESALAELEGVEAAICFATGMAAIHAVVTACAFWNGGRVVAQEDLYGQTRVLFERFAREQGAPVAFVDPADLDAVERALAAAPAPGSDATARSSLLEGQGGREGGRVGVGAALLFVEAISNPLLRVVDIAALAARAHARGARLVVDATMPTPVLVRPRALGADIVVHSLTKYLNGHGDAQGGVAAGSRELAAEMRDRVILDGAYLPPHEAWLILRGLRTLQLRMDRHCANALAVARHLAAHPKVARVHYPGLPDHPQHALAKRQFGGRFGGVVSFVLRGDARESAFRFLDALELAASATTFGDLYTEVLYPPISSHRRLAPEERRRLGISDGFLRLNVGIEEVEDIVADLDRALAAV